MRGWIISKEHLNISDLTVQDGGTLFYILDIMYVLSSQVV